MLMVLLRCGVASLTNHSLLAASEKSEPFRGCQRVGGKRFFDATRTHGFANWHLLHTLFLYLNPFQTIPNHRPAGPATQPRRGEDGPSHQRRGEGQGPFAFKPRQLSVQHRGERIRLPDRKAERTPILPKNDVTILRNDHECHFLLYDGTNLCMIRPSKGMKDTRPQGESDQFVAGLHSYRPLPQGGKAHE